jgi:hypothetical protein
MMTQAIWAITNLVSIIFLEDLTCLEYVTPILFQRDAIVAEPRMDLTDRTVETRTNQYQDKVQ